MKYNKETDTIMRVDKSCGCAMCHEQTHFINVLIEDYICSDECLEAFFKMADDATYHGEE